MCSAEKEKADFKIRLDSYYMEIDCDQTGLLFLFLKNLHKVMANFSGRVSPCQNGKSNSFSCLLVFRRYFCTHTRGGEQDGGERDRVGRMGLQPGKHFPFAAGFERRKSCIFCGGPEWRAVQGGRYTLLEKAFFGRVSCSFRKARSNDEWSVPGLPTIPILAYTNCKAKQG